MTSQPPRGIAWRLRRTADQAAAAWQVLVPPARRYAEYESSGLALVARARLYVARLADLPEAVRSVPRATGGATLRWEQGTWVVRPRVGWRSFWWAPPLHRSAGIPRDDDDAATTWAEDVYVNPR